MSSKLFAMSVDFETVADPELVAKYFPEPKIKDEPIVAKIGNIKDPIKIAEKEAAAAEAAKERQAKVAEAKAAHYERAAMDPHCARIIAAGFAWRDPDTNAFRRDGLVSSDLSDAAEIRLITETFDMLRRVERVVTFNGRSFDIPFLYRRALLLGIAPPFVIETNRYKVIDGSSNHVDVRCVLAETSPGSAPADYCRGNLDYYAGLLLGKSKTEGIDGSRVAEFFADGCFEEIRLYAADDAAIELELYEKVQGFYFV